jgi:hypothetical protein
MIRVAAATRKSLHRRDRGQSSAHLVPCARESPPHVHHPRLFHPPQLRQAVVPGRPDTPPGAQAGEKTRFASVWTARGLRGRLTAGRGPGCAPEYLIRGNAPPPPSDFAFTTNRYSGDTTPTSHLKEPNSSVPPTDTLLTEAIPRPQTRCPRSFPGSRIGSRQTATCPKSRCDFRCQRT